MNISKPNNASVLAQVNISMLRKQMDQMELQSEQMTQMSNTTQVVGKTKLDASV